MRLLLVGRPRERERLRAELEHSPFTVAAEFRTVAEARASGVESDALLLADPQGPRHTDEERRAEENPLEERLTAREVEVVELLAQGLPNKAIAARLGISDQTVKFHVASLSGKLGAANRTDAVRRAVRRGLISL